MAKQFIKGQFKNLSTNSDKTAKQLGKQNLFTTKFVKTLIIRGIGYRSFTVNNDFFDKKSATTQFMNTVRPIYSGDSSEPSIIASIAAFDCPNSAYLLLRAGHTKDKGIALATGIQTNSSKKDRKLVVSGQNAVLVANTAKHAYLYRKPSVYTGRGIRFKHVRPIRKAGKKDKQKGKAF